MAFAALLCELGQDVDEVVKCREVGYLRRGAEFTCAVENGAATLPLGVLVNGDDAAVTHVGDVAADAVG